MKWTVDRHGLTAGRISLTPGVIFAGALLLYTGCGPVLGACLVAAVIHEAGHILACGILRVPILRLRLTLVGAVLELGGRCRSGAEECLVALAGPLANLLTGWAAMNVTIPGEGRYLFAGASVMLALFNLLPVIPLDGSRALHGAASAVLPLDRADWLAGRISGLWGLLLLAPGIYFALRGNCSLMLVILWLTLSQRENKGATPLCFSCQSGKINSN